MLDGKRKIIITSVAFAIGLVFSYFGKLDTVTSDFIVYMTGAYVVGNVGEHFAKRAGKE